MKLYNSPLSPFARKCRIVALELGLADRLELVAQSVSPVTPDAKYLQNANPLGKIPALLLDDGRALYDSHVICEYLCALAGDTRLVPAGDARWDVLTRQALASGMTDAIILVRYETALRPEALRWADWRNGQMDKIHTSLLSLEQAPQQLHERVDLGTLALGCALGYLDLRFDAWGWRQRYPQLAAWAAGFMQRPSLQASWTV